MYSSALCEYANNLRCYFNLGVDLIIYKVPVSPINILIISVIRGKCNISNIKIVQLKCKDCEQSKKESQHDANEYRWRI